jgi:hypothetical protein
MEKQQATISGFNKILEIFLCLHVSNSIILAEVMEKLNIAENERGFSGNNYINMAKNILKEKLEAAKRIDEKFKNTDEQIKKIGQHISGFYNENEYFRANIESMGKKNKLLLLIIIGEVIIIIYLLIEKFVLKQ